MVIPRYALVAYVRSPVGEFVEKLRRELHPEMPHLAAHLTVLPPRTLPGNEREAVDALAQMCRTIDPFEVELGEVETFTPVTPTVFIRVTLESQRMRELHDLFVKNHSLRGSEEWPYMPHLTIIKFGSEGQVQPALDLARRRWAEFQGIRRVRIKELTFVREDANKCWVDLSSVTLGSREVVPTP